MCAIGVANLGDGQAIRCRRNVVQVAAHAESAQVVPLAVAGTERMEEWRKASIVHEDLAHVRRAVRAAGIFGIVGVAQAHAAELNGGPARFQLHDARGIGGQAIEHCAHRWPRVRKAIESRTAYGAIRADAQAESLERLIGGDVRSLADTLHAHAVDGHCAVVRRGAECRAGFDAPDTDDGHCASRSSPHVKRD